MVHKFGLSDGSHHQWLGVYVRYHQTFEVGLFTSCIKSKNIDSKDRSFVDTLYFKCHPPRPALAKGQSVTFLNTLDLQAKGKEPVLIGRSKAHI